MSERLKKAIEAFDQANAADPNQEMWQGKSYPKELLYGQRMTACLNSFEPNASEVLQLAARCQHICRWEIPRNTYPMDKTGYHAWRNYLKKYHAEKAGAIMENIGYEAETIQEVQKLLQKKQLKRNPDTQTLEDVICLVFLEYYLVHCKLSFFKYYIFFIDFKIMFIHFSSGMSDVKLPINSHIIFFTFFDTSENFFF